MIYLSELLIQNPGLESFEIGRAHAELQSH